MAKIKVLLVDDDAVLCRTIKAALGRTGNYETRTECSPSRAKQVATDFVPDVIILDVDMPELDGGDVAAILKNNAVTRDIPIIFLTSLKNKKEEVSAPSVETDEYVVAKPVAASELTNHIERVLSKAKCVATTTKNG